MCIRWFKDKPITWEYSSKIALLFAINNYPGGENDLDYCINDIDLVRSNLPSDFQVRRFVNEKVTRKCFKEQLLFAISHALPGDIIYVHYSGHGSYVPDVHGDEVDGYDETLYLYDGNLLDDELNAICKTIPLGVHVSFGMDCCFSGSNTRLLTGNPYKVRFMPPKKSFPAHIRVKQALRTEGMNWVVMSGCKENETSGEGIINGTGHGAYTYYQQTVKSADLTYRKWNNKVCIYLPNKTFNQTPTIEGPDELIDLLILT
jgi:hypothetical protein